MKSFLDKLYLIALILLLIASFTNAQQFTKERYLVEVGWQVGKFPPDTSGIRKAFDAASSLRESGKFVTVQFAPGIYQLDSTFIRLRDSVNVNFAGKVVFRGKHTKGIFTDDSLVIASIWNGNPEMINTADTSKRLVLKHSSSSVSFLAGTSEGAEWGSISGSLSSQSDLQSALSAKFDKTDTSGYYPKTMTNALLAAKENSISSGTTGEYLRGDKSWQTLDKSSVGLSNVDNLSQEQLKDSVLKNPVVTGAMGTEALYSDPVNLGLFTTAIDWKVSNIFYATCNSAREFTFSNTQEGQIITLVVILTDGDAVTFDEAALEWPDDTAPTSSTGSGRDVYTFMRVNGKIYGAMVPYVARTW